MASKPKLSRAKVREHRDGLRPMQICVLDRRAPTLQLEAHRQSLAVGAGGRGDEDQTFIDAVSDWGRE